MADLSHASLVKRVERLELENRRFRHALSVVLLVVSSVFLMGQAQAPEISEVVRAKSFEVIGDDDRVVLEVGSLEGLAGKIEIYDAAGEARVLLLPGVGSFFDSAGVGLVQLGEDENGLGQVVTYGNGHLLVGLGGDDNGSGAITTANNEGIGTVRIGSDIAGSGRIGLSDSEGTELITAAISNRGPAVRLDSKNDDGTTTVEIELVAGETGGFAVMRNSDEVVGVQLEATGNGGLLATYNNDGQLSASLATADNAGGRIDVFSEGKTMAGLASVVGGGGTVWASDTEGNLNQLAVSEPWRTGAGFQSGNTLVQNLREYRSVTRDGSGVSIDAGVYMGYVVGVFDSTQDRFCTGGRTTVGQAAAIVGNYLDRNPNEWSLPGPGLVLAAMREAFPCD